MTSKRTEIILKLARQSVSKEPLSQSYQNEDISQKTDERAWKIVPKAQSTDVAIPSQFHSTCISEDIQSFSNENKSLSTTHLDLPSTSNGSISTTTKNIFRIINNNEDESSSSFDDSDADPNYVPNEHTRTKHVFNCNVRKITQVSSQQKRDLGNERSSDSDSESSTVQNERVNIDFLEREPQQHKRGRKRVSDKGKWLKNKAKLLKNSGQAYVSMSKSKKEIPEKKLKPPCDDRCKLKN